MANSTGIKTTKNSQGEYTSITIDLKKHQYAIKSLTEIGIIIEDNFEKKWGNPDNVTVEEARKSSLQHIDSLPWKI